MSSGDASRPIAGRPIAGRIAVPALIDLTKNTALFLYQDLRPTQPNDIETLASVPLGFIDILRSSEQLPPEFWNSDASTCDTLRHNVTRADDIHVAYFATCLSAHHATVATFVPTDVDNQIRGTLWQSAPSSGARARMRVVTTHSLQWDVSCLSERVNQHSGRGPVSGHNGEQLGVLAGALGASIAHNEVNAATEMEELIHAELTREAQEFDFVCSQRGMEIEVAQLAASLTHNMGDLHQGMNFWRDGPAESLLKLRYDRDNDSVDTRTGWRRSFRRALAVYKALMAPEGHRHYPLRSVQALRRGKELLLPLSPFLDGWGQRIATSTLLSDHERGETLAALLLGCKKIPGQIGYYRAIAGMVEGLGGDLHSLSRLSDALPHSARTILKDSHTRQLISVKRASFESSMRKRVHSILEAHS